MSSKPASSSTKLGFLSVLVFLGLMLGAPLGFAQTSQLQNTQDYIMTYESCRLYLADSSIKGGIVSVLNPQAIDVIQSKMGDIEDLTNRIFSADPEATDRLQRNGGLSTYLSVLMQSEGFHQALRDCFPKESLRKMYVANLILLDSAVSIGITTGYIRMLGYAAAHFSSLWVKALFAAHMTPLLTASSPQTKRSFNQMMADQYENLSAQVDAILRAQRQKKWE